MRVPTASQPDCGLQVSAPLPGGPWSKQVAVPSTSIDTDNGSKRKYLSQTDVPSCSLDKALDIPRAIADNYGYKPSTPIQVASAMDLSPTSPSFRMLAGAAIAYGLTKGGPNAPLISIEPLGMRVVKPSGDEDVAAAKRKALLTPRVIRLFLEKYNGAAIPRSNIAESILRDMGVPKEKTSEVLKLILEGAEAVGFITTINQKKFVDLLGANPAPGTGEDSGEEDEEGSADSSIVAKVPHMVPSSRTVPIVIAPNTDSRVRKVYLTHGKNRALIEPIKELLKFGELEAVVSIQSQTVSQPVPTKVMLEMRGCGAAIIHVEDERHLKDEAGNEVVVLNDNVLTEIGAAMALFGERFILVVKDGVKLPSNLQGLPVQPYKGTTLDMEETVKLMKAINDMKNRPLPHTP